MQSQEILFGFFLSLLFNRTRTFGRSIAVPLRLLRTRERKKKRGTKNQLVVSEQSEIDQRDNRSKWSMTKHSEKSIYPPLKKKKKNKTKRWWCWGRGKIPTQLVVACEIYISLNTDEPPFVFHVFPRYGGGGGGG